ncbi:ROK family protein [Alicyclobacillus curvatus]|nr:ROK family protein [Alicyclobacillus curvatus]
MIIKNHSQLRDFNVELIFRLIRKMGPVSRTTLSETTGLAPSTVSVITSHLQDRGVIRERGRAVSTGGRRPVLLEVDPVGGYFITADLIGSHLSFGVVDLSLELTHMESLDEPSLEGEPLYAQLLRGFNQVASHCEHKKCPILGYGVATPGLIDSDGRVIEADNLGWHGFDLQSKLAKDLSAMVVVQNDTNAAAFGEFQYGSLYENGWHNMLFVSVDTGVGTGLVLNGSLFRGARGLAGEFGHVTIDPNGLTCACGRQGCLETIASAPAMVREYQRRGGDFKGAQPTFEELVANVHLGDPTAVTVIQEAAKMTGIAISNQINMLNVDVVILGGAVIRKSDLFFQTASAYAKRTLPGLAEGLAIQKSLLGPQAGLVGIASLSIDQLFSAPTEVRS